MFVDDFNFYFGEVTFLQDQNDLLNYNLEGTQPFTGPAIPPHRIFALEGWGSGFVIGTNPNGPTVAGQRVKGIGVTASHCLGYISHVKTFGCLTLYDSNGVGSPPIDWATLKNFGNANGIPGNDPITGAEYPLPSDIALLALNDCMSDAKFAIGNPRIINQITVAGRPRVPDQLETAAPGLASRTSDQGVIEDQVNRAFHDFDCPVYSVGDVKGLNSDYIAFHAPTVNGMSGSPIFTSPDNVVGMLISGHILPGMREALRLANAFINEDHAGIQAEFNSFVPYLGQVETGRSIIAEYDSLMANTDPAFEDGCRTAACDLCKGASGKLILQGSKLRHNLGMSAEHPAFQKVPGAVQIFESMSSQDFPTMGELAVALGL